MKQATSLFSIDPREETARITTFIQKVLFLQKKKHVIIGISGGIDSTTALHLLVNALSPKNVFAISLPYFDTSDSAIVQISKKVLPNGNFQTRSITQTVNALALENGVEKTDYMRLGNIMARIRMTSLYDLAKKHNALVCGTENKSEYFLGYFTRFGDEASDIEPIRHLYKSQVYQLAKYLHVPKKQIEQAPTAGLWAGQTDEKEFGFSYQEADSVLYYYLEKKLYLEEIESKGYKNAKKIIDRVKDNEFKHHVPYAL